MTVKCVDMGVPFEQQTYSSVLNKWGRRGSDREVKY